jgi:hypothetical protein
MTTAELKSLLIQRAALRTGARAEGRSARGRGGSPEALADALLRESLRAEPRALEIALDRMIDRVERASRRGAGRR